MLFSPSFFERKQQWFALLMAAIIEELFFEENAPRASTRPK